jgi:O-antigen ligase
LVHTNGVSQKLTRDWLTGPGNDGRIPLWNAAVHIYRKEEVHGTGAGTYELHYIRCRTERSYVVDTHSLCLRSLAELRVVGFALILVVVLGMLGGLRRASADPTWRCMRRCSRRRWPARSTRPSTGTGMCRRPRSAC